MNPDVPRTLIVDTNVWLDWLVFDDPAAQPWRDAVQAGRARVHASARMRDELAEVLARPPLAARRARSLDEALAEFDRWVVVHPEPAAAPWHCTDPDDQCFLDLAWTLRPALLLTRDRALLRLARRAARDAGVRIAAPPASGRREVLGAGAALAALLGACGPLATLGPQPPRLEFVSLSVSELRLDQLRLQLRLMASNPNGFELAVRDFRFDLWLLDQPLAQARGGPEVLRVPARGQAELPLTLQARTADLWSLLRKVPQADLARLPWKLRGDARWGEAGFQIPFSRSGEIDLLARLRGVVPGH